MDLFETIGADVRAGLASREGYFSHSSPKHVTLEGPCFGRMKAGTSLQWDLVCSNFTHDAVVNPWIQLCDSAKQLYTVSCVADPLSQELRPRVIMCFSFV